MMSRLRRSLPLLLLAAFAVAMLSPLIFEDLVFYYRDFGRFFHPIKQVCLERMLGGEFPIWLPEVNCGIPVHGEMVHGLLYPGNVLLLAGEGRGWGLYFAAHLVLAGLSMWALARRLGAQGGGAILAGLAYAGSGYLVGQLPNVAYGTVAAWSPLLVLLCLSAGEGRRGAVPLLALALAIAALAGEPFTLLLTILLAVVLVLGGAAGRARLGALLRIGLAGGVALLLASPALLPAAEQLGQSVRVGEFELARPDMGSLHPARLLTLLSPECFGRQQVAWNGRPTLLGLQLRVIPPILVGAYLGAVTLLALVASPLRRSRTALLLAIVGAVSLVLSLGAHVGLSRTLTGFGVFRYPAKYWFLVTSAAAVLAGLAAPRLGRVHAVPAFAAGGLSLAVGLHLASPATALTGATPFLLAGAVLFLPARHRVRALTGVLGLELLFFGIRMNVAVPPDELRPSPDLVRRLRREDPGRIFASSSAPTERALTDVVRWNLDSLHALESNGGIREGFSYAIGNDPIEPLRRIGDYFSLFVEADGTLAGLIFYRSLCLTGTTHIFLNWVLDDDLHFRPVETGVPDLRGYAFRNPAPRARLYGAIEPVPNTAAGRRRLLDYRFDPFEGLLVEGVEPEEPAGPPSGTVEFVEDSSTEVRLRVSSDRSAWLFLADAWAPGWKATVNGAPVEVFPALLAFRAVRVPEGNSVVVFRYRPSWLRIVPYSAGAGILLLVLLTAASVRSGRSGPARPRAGESRKEAPRP